MQAVLKDVVKKIGGLGFIDTIKVSGTADATKIEAVDNDKTVIIKAKLNITQDSLAGEFGVSSLPLLQGLLNFTSYQTDTATFNVKRRDVSGKTVPEEFEFRDENGLGSNFRLMSGNLVPEQPLVADIKWDVSFVPSKSKIQEFASLAGLYSQFDQFFSVKTKDGNVVLSIGASMVFASEIDGELKGELLWPISQFLGILKMADGNDFSVNITSKGAMQIAVQTEHAEYQYILPARRR
jgi:hypothetical protein